MESVLNSKVSLKIITNYQNYLKVTCVDLRFPPQLNLACFKPKFLALVLDLKTVNVSLSRKQRWCLKFI